jgi:hypothetical protein
MCSAEKFGAASGERRAGAVVPPLPHDPTRNFSQNNRLIRSRFYELFAPFLPGSAQNVESDVTCSKQSTGKFLPGATTTCIVAQFLTKFRATPGARRKKESASRDASEQGKIPLKAQYEKEPS